MADERVVKIKLEGSSARADANRINNSVKGIGASADKSSTSMLNLSRVASGVITALSTAKIIAYADAWTNVNNRIRAATTTSKEFSTAQESIISIAQRAGVELSGVADAYSRISQATSELGISQERVLDVTEKLTLALKAGGATGSETSSVMIQLAQGLGSGALQGDELRSILEASIPITKALSKEFGVTVGELKKLGSEGKLTADRVVEAIENMDESALTFTKDISSGFTEVNNALTVYVGKMDESLGASEGISGVLSGLAANLDMVVAVTGEFIKLGVAVYLTNMTKALIANTAAFAANQVQIIRYNAALAAGAGVSRVAASATWALTYAMRALKAALPFGVVLLGLEVLQRYLTATNDQIEANDRYSESIRKLNDRLDTKAEKEAATALRVAAEVNANNQQRLADHQAKLEDQRIKLQKSNAAELAKIRGQEYEEADRLALYQVSKTQNRIRLMEDEAKRLAAIAASSQASLAKLQGAIGGQTDKDTILSGVFADPSSAVGGKEKAQTNKDLDNFFAQGGVFSGGADETQGDDGQIIAKLERENQMIQQSLLNRKSIYSQFFADANDLNAGEYERQRAQLEFSLAMQRESESQSFQARLQAITDRQMVIAENKALNEDQKREAQTLLDDQIELARQDFENRLTEIARMGAAEREVIARSEIDSRMQGNQYLLQAQAGLQGASMALLQTFAGKSKKAALALLAVQKGLAIANTLTGALAGSVKVYGELPYPAAVVASGQILAQGKLTAGLIAAQGISQAASITSGGGGAGGSAPSSASVSTPQPRPSANAGTQNQRRIIDIRGLENGGSVSLNKDELIDLLSNDDNVILSVNNGQAQGSRVGLI